MNNANVDSRRRGAPLARLLGSLLAVMASACGGGGGGDSEGRSIGAPEPNPGLPETTTLAPENTGDGWAVSSAAAENLDADVLIPLLASIRDGSYPGVDSMVIARSGRLVAEGYFNGFGRDSLHDLRSTGKSVTSALAGIAIDQGLMSLDDPISQHLPGFSNHANMDERKRAISIRHLLNMSSGLECNDWDPQSPGNEERMYNSRDWVRFILDLRMSREPGVAAYYCTGAVVVLGHIVSLRSGMALDDFAAAYLFAPLRIEQSRWRRSPDGRATGGGGLWLRPRDAAKFGSLFLAGGTWQGARVVSASWVDASRQSHYTLREDGYGLLWWKRTFNHEAANIESFYTAGNGGNYIFVIPALDLVVVFTGSNYNSRLGDQPFEILQDRLLPAVR